MPRGENIGYLCPWLVPPWPKWGESKMKGEAGRGKQGSCSLERGARRRSECFRSTKKTACTPP